MLQLDDLLITQNALRDIGQLPDMIAFVKGGGKFNATALGSYAIRKGLARVCPPIEIAQFEDGAVAIHNGHHRAAAIYIGREEKILYSSEYFIKEWKYENYNEINLPHWVTPFDVQIEIRIPDLTKWKNEVIRHFVEFGEARTKEFIMDNRNQFCEPRLIYTIEDLLEKSNLGELQ